MCPGVLSESGGFQAWFWWTVGGKREKVVPGKLEDIIWFRQQQELQEVRNEGTDFWMLSQIRGVVRLKLLLPQRDINTHCYSFEIIYQVRCDVWKETVSSTVSLNKFVKY